MSGFALGFFFPSIDFPLSDLINRQINLFIYFYPVHSWSVCVCMQEMEGLEGGRYVQNVQHYDFCVAIFRMLT